jgi:hypothetical protein
MTYSRKIVQAVDHIFAKFDGFLVGALNVEAFSSNLVRTTRKMD